MANRIVLHEGDVIDGNLKCIGSTQTANAEISWRPIVPQDMSLQATSSNILLRQVAGGVATLTLNRPDQYNALSKAMLDAIESAFDDLAADPSVRVVVIAANGKAFCAGHDLREIQTAYELESIRDLFTQCSRVMEKLVALPQPVIARVHGIATAAGCQLVAQCDLAVAADVSRFATSGINIGVFCSNPAVPLTRNVGRKQAMEMLLTGQFIDANTALQRGLVNRVVPLEGLDQAVNELAQAIMSKPRDAIAAGKKLLYRQLELGLDSAYQVAAETMACDFMHRDAAEGLDAFVNKRKPDWA